MNSSTDSQNEIVNEESASGSQISADRNANTNAIADQSKGAIPKTKVSKSAGAVTKKSLKINNNIESMSTLNCVNSSDLLRNGFSKCLSVTNNFFNNSTCSPNGSDTENSVGSGFKDSRGENCEYDYSCLNIPVDGDFLNGSYMPQVKDQPQNELSLYPNEINHQETESDSSSDDNELLSVSDDGCIYTYKADHVADLPSSFYNLEIPPLETERNRASNSSPEMDFLEMDFDPGPSGDADSDSVRVESPTPKKVNPVLDVKEVNVVEVKPSCSKDVNQLKPQPIDNTIEQFSKIIKEVCMKRVSLPPAPAEVKMPWSCSVEERTEGASYLRIIKRHHNSKGELVSPSECLPSSPNGETISNLSSFHNAMGKILIEEKCSFDQQSEKIMIWPPQDALFKQVTQIAPSSCGATAVLNVLNALRIPLPPDDKIQELVETNFRSNDAPLTEYLISRSKAGCTHRGIIAGLYKASEGRVYSRFFSMYPERVVNLQKWLGYWIKHGAVPIATLNLQKCVGRIPDSWHHQMIFGVGPKGIYFTNPLERVEADLLWPQLSSESVLLVRREDVLSRFNQQVDFPQLMKINDVRWRELNVVGQVAKIIRESRREIRLGSTTTSHIKIPAQYRSGITLAIDITSPYLSFLRQCPELPLLYPIDTANAFNDIR